MIILINVITLIDIIYSYWYMSNDKHIIRFISLLLLFISSMLILVTNNNIIIILLGWEGVGLMSYLLINYWYTSIDANKSSIKAMLYNRLGDIFYMLGIILLIININSTNYNNLYSITGSGSSSLEWIILCFLLTSITKSAQYIFHGWLGTSMVASTSVSALLHASTMIVGGIYLLCRLCELIISSIIIKNIIIIIGSITIVFGGLVSITQLDIKRIIAYSTCSQLGYMLLSLGLNNKNISIYHLMTHAFYKALLFMLAGIIIHCCLNYQDIRKLGNLIFFLPINYIFIIISSLSLMSMPFFSGYYSKEAIINLNLINNNNFFENNLYFNINTYILSIIGSFLTSIYSINLIKRVFFESQNTKYNIKEAPFWLYNILFILLIMSLILGYLTKDLFIGFGNHFNNDLEFLPYIYKLLPILIVIIGLFLIINFDIFKFYFNFKNSFFLFNKKLYTESIINNIFSKLLLLSYHININLDKGLFEKFGFIGFIQNTFKFKKFLYININFYIFLLIFINILLFILS